MDDNTSSRDILNVHYVKNQDFRTVFTSCIYGGITINGLINVNFCLDRGPIPTTVENEVEQNENGKSQLKPKVVHGKEGVIREVQFGAIMDIQTAKTIVDWLQKQITITEELSK
jgi:hypothetical protein